MPYNIDMIDLIVKEAIEHKYELPWIELKENNYDPQLIGEYISALSNTAALYNQEHAFMIWGVEDNSHKVVGTDFEPQAEKIGNQGLELWLAIQLNPQVQFYFHSVNLEGKRVVLLEIGRAFSSPVKFKNIDYIRIDSYKKKLKDFPDTERELWAIFSQKPFETMIAMENVSKEFVLRELDYASYFEMLSLDLPSNTDGIIESLLSDGMIS